MFVVIRNYFYGYNGVFKSVVCCFFFFKNGVVLFFVVLVFVVVFCFMELNLFFLDFIGVVVVN